MFTLIFSILSLCLVGIIWWKKWTSPKKVFGPIMIIGIALIFDGLANSWANFGYFAVFSALLAPMCFVVYLDNRRSTKSSSER